MNPSITFDLRLFGSPSIRGMDGAALTGRVAQRHRIALMALLALAPGQRLSRDKAMAFLWPESSQEQARQLLNQAVYNVRKVLGEGVILSAGDDLRLNAEVIRTDVAELETAATRGDHERVAALYTGPFLDGFFLDGSNEFESWVQRERQRLADAYARSLDTLAEAAERRLDHAGAVEWWRARAAHDPFDTRVTLRLMQAMEAAGNRAGALQLAAVHERLLEEELGINRPPELLALVERMRNEPLLADEGTRKPAERDAAASPPLPRVTAPIPIAPAAAASSQPPDPLIGTGSIPRIGRAGLYGLAAVFLGLVVLGAIRWSRGSSANPSSGDPALSIAVLPLGNLSTDPRDAPFADAMTEELIAVLARSGVLRVVGSTSAFAFRNTTLDIPGIADSLGVEHVLEGTVQKSGARIRVRVRLLDASDGSTRWSETFDRELLDVFAVQDEIARAVALDLGARLPLALRKGARGRQTDNVAAYELYLRGSDPTLLRSDSAALEAVKYLRQAIALDTTYAAAYAALTRLYIRTRWVPEAGTSPGDRLLLAETAALKAVALDESLADSHEALGLVRNAAYDFKSGEAHLKRAVDLDPARAFPHELLVRLYVLTERPAEALAEAERALRIDRLSPSANAERARALLANGRCDEALAQLQKIASVKPPLLRAQTIAATCHIRTRNWPEAIALLRPQRDRGGTLTLALFGYALGRGGQSEEAHRIRAELVDQWRRGASGAMQVSLVYAGLGDLDQAFAWLERSVQERSLNLDLADPLFRDLRHDPRFARYRARMGFQRG